MSNLKPEQKDTIYVDVDDEITSIIDKVRSSNAKVVALVLPKRASVLQSIVNMKLLKRTAEGAKKHLVLVTTEAGLLPLAGTVGLHVAATPTSKPAIPPVPDMISDQPENIDEPLSVDDEVAVGGDTASDFDPKRDGNTPVGDLAAAGASGAAGRTTTPPVIDDEIQLDDDGVEVAAGADAASGKTPKAKKNHKLMVPNFDSFRKKIALAAGVLVLLIFGWILAFVILPSATVTIHTDTSTVTTNLNLTLDTAAKSLETSQNIVPATAQTAEKSYTQQVPSTGQQNNGDKATGEVKFTAKKCNGAIGIAPSDVPTGTGLSGNSRTYITQTTMAFTFNGFSNGGTCANYSSNNTAIVAQSGGTIFNTDSTSFAVGGRSDISGTGSADGGTDNITKVVAQTDIDSAKSKISTQDTSSIRQGLQATLQGKSLKPITSTFIAGDPQITTSAKVGDAADTVTVTEVIGYTMLGIKEADIKSLVVDNVNKQIDKSKHVILDDGIKAAKFVQSNQGSATAASVVFSAKSIAGPDIDVDSLKPDLVGKKSGDIKSQIEAIPGVTNVEVKYSPFWVHATPKKASKITVQLDKANTGKQ